MQEYLLSVSKGAATDVASFVALDKSPTHVRLSSSGAGAILLKPSQAGVVTGQKDDDAAPHDLVPWHSTACLSDGPAL